MEWPWVIAAEEQTYTLGSNLVQWGLQGLPIL